MPAPAAPSESAAAAVVVLGYHVDDLSSSPPRRWPRVVLLAGTVPLLVVPFVAFTHGVSPMYAVTEVARMVLAGSRNLILLIGLLAGPFFLAVPIFLWQARLLAAPRTTSAERGVAYALAGATSLMTISYFAFGVASTVLEGNSRFGWDMMVVAAAAGTAAAAALAPWWARRFVRRPEARVAIALNLAYLANAGMCLYGFADDPNAGWSLTLAGSAALLAELALITAEARRSTRSAGTLRRSAPASAG